MPLDSTRRALLGRIGELAALAGFGRTPAQIYALLLMSEEPLSLDDMASALELSKASVSVSVRELAGHGAVRRAWGRASRRDLWEPEDIRRVLQLWARSGLARRIEEIDTILKEAEGSVASGARQGRAGGGAGGVERGTSAKPGESRGKVAERLAGARALHAQVTALIRMLPSLLDSGASSDAGEADAGSAPAASGTGRPRARRVRS